MKAVKAVRIAPNKFKNILHLNLRPREVRSVATGLIVDGVAVGAQEAASVVRQVYILEIDEASKVVVFNRSKKRVEVDIYVMYWKAEPTKEVKR